MFTQNKVGLLEFFEPIKQSAIKNWNDLDEGKKVFSKKLWSLVTYKWRWQVALNLPFLIFWVLDKNIPSLHEFDLKIISMLPIPEWVGSYLNQFLF